VAECQLPKLNVGGSTPLSRSILGPAQKQLHILDADASRPAALRKLEISRIFLRFRAWPDGRLHAQFCEFIFARTLNLENRSIPHSAVSEFDAGRLADGGRRLEWSSAFEPALRREH
jgi:hypothetical protein